jgi:PAS domain-containing protein
VPRIKVGCGSVGAAHCVHARTCKGFTEIDAVDHSLTRIRSGRTPEHKKVWMRMAGPVSPTSLEAQDVQAPLLQDAAQMLVHSVIDYAIYMLDLEGTVKTWNAGAERLKCYTPQEIIGREAGPGRRILV